ncbi:MAG: monovalent cation/H+ antiporter complex subunit F [Cyclobacteriaceae bacterium]
MNLQLILLYVSISILILALILIMVRFIKGPSLPDRIISLDLISSALIAILALYSMISGTKSTLEVALVLSLITFLGTMVFANYILEKIKK